MASVPRPPARSRGIYSPLRRGGNRGGAVYLVACYSKNGEGETANSDAGDGSAIVRKKGASNYSLKPLVLASETKGFTA